MTTTVNFNRFKSTAIFGTFSNVDSSNGSILADGKFQRNLTIEGNLILGKQTLDANGNPVNSESSIQFTLDSILYNIPLRTLSYIKNVTSDIQQQLTNISNSSFSNITVSGLINGIKVKNYANENTSFSSGNTDVTGASNTRMGYFTGYLGGFSNAVFGDQSLQNCSGYNNVAIGHNSQNSNTSYNSNTTIGCESDVIHGSNNIAIGCKTRTTFCNNSIVIGNDITCNTHNQILLGNSSHTVNIPGSLTFSQNLNNISATTFGYLSGLTSNIQDYMNNKNNFFSIISQNIGNQNTAFGLLSFSSNTSGGYNTVFGYNSMTSNTSGAYCTSVGCNSLQTSNAIGNTAIGFNSGVNITNGTYNTFIGCNSQSTSDVSNSTAIGRNAICDASNQIMLGTSNETVVIPGNLRIFQNINNIPFETFGFLSGLSGNIQNQINSSNSNISTLQTKTTDIYWSPGQINITTIYNKCETTTLSFSNTLNNISTTTFSYLSGLTSNIQQQINALSNVNPPGMIIAFAGTTNTLSGYLLCDGTIYNSSQYTYLFNAIGYTYGDAGNGNFRVPNYKGLFLRSTGSQSIQGKTYTSPNLGTTLNDKSTQIITNEFVDNINTQVKSVVTGSSDFMATYQYSNAISSLNFTKSSNTFNSGNLETHPVHTSVQYFIKY